MNKILKIIIAIIGACNVLIELMTPLAVAVIWIAYFGFSLLFSKIIMVMAGLATLFRAFRIGWKGFKKKEIEDD